MQVDVRLGVQPSIGGRGRSANFPSLLPSREVVAHRVSSAAGRGRRSRPAAEAGGRSKFPRSSEAVGEPRASAPGSLLIPRTVRKPAAASPRSLSPDRRSNGPGPDGPGSPLRTSPGEPGHQPPDRPVRTDVPPPRARRNRSRRTSDPSLGSATRRRRYRDPLPASKEEGSHPSPPTASAGPSGSPLPPPPGDTV